MAVEILSSERDYYTRGRLESRFVSAAPDPEVEHDSGVAKLLRSYYEYRVQRHIRTYILSSNNDWRSLHKLVQTVVRLGFFILLSRTKEEAKAADEILVETDFRCRRIENQPPRIGTQPRAEPSGPGFALGKAPVGRDIALGSNPAETVWTFVIDVELKMSQATALRQRPDVVECIMATLERCVPLNLDYVLRFRVDQCDFTMRLTRADKADAKSGVAPPIVGLNTALGKVKQQDS